MTKDEIKLLCETDDKLQWWAMLLFAEISEVIAHGPLPLDQFTLNFVKAKVEEFPKFVVSVAKQKAKKSLDPMQRIFEEACKKRAELMESFACEYLKHTGLKVTEVEMVERMDGQKIVWYLRKKGSDE